MANQSTIVLPFGLTMEPMEIEHQSEILLLITILIMVITFFRPETQRKSVVIVMGALTITIPLDILLRGVDDFILAASWVLFLAHWCQLVLQVCMACILFPVSAFLVLLVPFLAFQEFKRFTRHIQSCFGDYVGRHMVNKGARRHMRLQLSAPRRMIEEDLKTIVPLLRRCVDLWKEVEQLKPQALQLFNEVPPTAGWYPREQFLDSCIPRGPRPLTRLATLEEHDAKQCGFDPRLPSVWEQFNHQIDVEVRRLNLEVEDLNAIYDRNHKIKVELQAEELQANKSIQKLKSFIKSREFEFDRMATPDFFRKGPVPRVNPPAQPPRKTDFYKFNTPQFAKMVDAWAPKRPAQPPVDEEVVPPSQEERGPDTAHTSGNPSTEPSTSDHEERGPDTAPTSGPDSGDDDQKKDDEDHHGAGDSDDDDDNDDGNDDDPASGAVMKVPIKAQESASCPSSRLPDLTEAVQPSPTVQVSPPSPSTPTRADTPPLPPLPSSSSFPLTPVVDPIPAPAPAPAPQLALEGSLFDHVPELRSIIAPSSMPTSAGPPPPLPSSWLPAPVAPPTPTHSPFASGSVAADAPTTPAQAMSTGFGLPVTPALPSSSPFPPTPEVAPAPAQETRQVLFPDIAGWTSRPDRSALTASSSSLPPVPYSSLPATPTPGPFAASVDPAPVPAPAFALAPAPVSAPFFGGGNSAAVNTPVVTTQEAETALNTEVTETDVIMEDDQVDQPVQEAAEPDEPADSGIGDAMDDFQHEGQSSVAAAPENSSDATIQGVQSRQDDPMDGTVAVQTGTGGPQDNEDDNDDELAPIDLNDLNAADGIIVPSQPTAAPDHAQTTSTPGPFQTGSGGHQNDDDDDEIAPIDLDDLNAADGIIVSSQAAATPGPSQPTATPGPSQPALIPGPSQPAASAPASSSSGQVVENEDEDEDEEENVEMVDVILPPPQGGSSVVAAQPPLHQGSTANQNAALPANSFNYQPGPARSAWRPPIMASCRPAPSNPIFQLRPTPPAQASSSRITAPAPAFNFNTLPSSSSLGSGSGGSTFVFGAGPSGDQSSSTGAKDKGKGKATDQPATQGKAREEPTPIFGSAMDGLGLDFAVAPRSAGSNPFAVSTEHLDETLSTLQLKMKQVVFQASVDFKRRNRLDAGRLLNGVWQTLLIEVAQLEAEIDDGRLHGTMAEREAIVRDFIERFIDLMVPGLNRDDPARVFYRTVMVDAVRYVDFIPSFGEEVVIIPVQTEQTAPPQLTAQPQQTTQQQGAGEELEDTESEVSEEE